MVHAMRWRAVYVPTYSVSTLSLSLSLGGHAGVALASPWRSHVPRVCSRDPLTQEWGLGDAHMKKPYHYLSLTG